MPTIWAFSKVLVQELCRVLLSHVQKALIQASHALKVLWVGVWWATEPICTHMEQNIWMMERMIAQGMKVFRPDEIFIHNELSSKCFSKVMLASKIILLAPSQTFATQFLHTITTHRSITLKMLYCFNNRENYAIIEVFAMVHYPVWCAAAQPTRCDILVCKWVKERYNYDINYIDCKC